MAIVEIDGRRVNVREVGGAGPSALLLHGVLSHSGEWRRLFDLSGERLRLVAPDLPGYGRSDPIETGHNPCFVDDTRLLCSILDRQEQPMHVVGDNLGAVLATRLAAAMPRQVLSLTLIDPFAFALVEEAGRVDWLEAAALGYQVLSATAFDERATPARRVFDFLYGDGAYVAAPEEVRTYVSLMGDRLAADWRGFALDAPGQLTEFDYRRIETPIRVLLRGEARASVCASAELIAAAAPNAEIRRLDVSENPPSAVLETLERLAEASEARNLVSATDGDIDDGGLAARLQLARELDSRKYEQNDRKSDPLSDGVAETFLRRIARSEAG